MSSSQAIGVQHEKDGGKSAQETRVEKLKGEINEIWKEINKDVEELSKDPPDERIRRKWKKGRVFDHWRWGRQKGEEQAQGKADEGLAERIEDPTKAILEIMEKVTPYLASNKGKSHERLRAAVTNTVQCIDTLGKAIAGGASQAFAPASSCFEAISFFLQFWLNYVEMLEKLEELLTKCNDFIGRLHIYDFTNPSDDTIELRHIAAQLMGKLVKVLRFSVDIHTKKGVVMKKLAKQSFLGDSDIDQLMGEMSLLVEREHGLLAALTYKDITNIRQVMTNHQVTMDATGWRVAISKSLGFTDDEPKRLWKNKFGEIRNSLIPNTGKWYTESPEFKAWVSGPDQESLQPSYKPFVIIQGSKNSGKSHLMANIVNRLEQERSDHAIAYYFHDPSDREANRPTYRTRTLSLVSKCLLWQCATALGVLMKSMAAECQRIGYNPNVDDMWRQLFLHNPRIESMNKARFYILVDGVDDGVEDVIEVFKKLVEKRPWTFRVIIATRDSNVSRGMSDDLFYRLDLLRAAKTKQNKDLDSFIQQYMKSMPAFRGSKDPKAAEYRRRIEEKVHERSEGDFEWTAIIVERLRSRHLLADINQILNDMDGRRTNQINGEIGNLNKSLSSEEIREINEIILWVMASQVTPTVDDMSAVLSYRTQVESLMPLRRRLNPLLRANESGRIEFRLSEIRDQIPRRSTAPNIQNLVQPRVSNEIPAVPSQLSQADKEIVHRFLRYEAKPDESDNGLKADLGMLLVKLFKETRSIDKMFWWLYGSHGVDEIVRWFNDPVTIDSLPDTDKAWAKEVIDKQRESHRHEALLRRVAERMAECLFLDEKTYFTREQLTAVYFLDGFTARTANVEGLQRYQKDRDRLTWSEFCRIGDWISDWACASPEAMDKIHNKGWLWKIQIARAIFTVCENDQEATDVAEALLKEVQSLDGRPWQGNILACQTIAMELQIKKSYAEAQKILESVIETLTPKDAETHISKSDSLLASIALLDLGELYWKGDHKGHYQRERAVEMFRKSLDFDATRYERYIRVLRRYREERCHAQIIEFVENLTNGREFDRMYLVRLVYEFLDTDEFRRSILSAETQHKWDEVVDNVFRNAIRVAQGHGVELFRIHKTYGEILHQCGAPDREDDVLLQWETALKYGQPLAATSGDISWPELFSVIDPLAYIYLEKAREELDAIYEQAEEENIILSYSGKELYLAKHYLDRIKALEQKTDVWMNTKLACCLARYHTMTRDKEEAESAVSKVIAASIGVLSDNDETNDWFAYLQLWRIMDALQDYQNFVEARTRLQDLGTHEIGSAQWFRCDECKGRIPLGEPVYVSLESFELKYFDQQCFHRNSPTGRVAIIGLNASQQDLSRERRLDRERSLSAWKAHLKDKYVREDDITDVSQLQLKLAEDKSAGLEDQMSQLHLVSFKERAVRPPRGFTPGGRYHYDTARDVH